MTTFLFLGGGGFPRGAWPEDPGVIEVSGGANVGTGAGLSYQGLLGTVMQFRSIKAGASGNLTVTNNANDITLDVTGLLTALANVGTGAGLVFRNITGTTANLKSIKADGLGFVTVTNNADDITIGVAAIGDVNDGANVGTGAGQVFAGKIAHTLYFKTIKAGASGLLTVTNNAQDVTLDITGILTAGANVGTGQGNVFRDITGTTINHKTLKQGTNVTITDNANDITISAAGGGGLPEFQFYADQVNSPVNADWAVNAFATVVNDPAKNALTVRQFAPSVEQGIGFTLLIPAGATNIVIAPIGRAQTAPGVAKAVLLKLYNRDIPDNAAVGAWSAGTNLTALTIPTDANFHYYTQTLTLAGLGLTAGRLTQFQLNRLGTSGSDTLTTSNWLMEEFKISFT